jgi:hypothetical protein
MRCRRIAEYSFCTATLDEFCRVRDDLAAVGVDGALVRALRVGVDVRLG